MGLYGKCKSLVIQGGQLDKSGHCPDMSRLPSQTHQDGHGHTPSECPCMSG